MEVEGARVYGTSLAWLTGSPVGGTDGRGVWQGKNLPARDLTLFAWSGGGGSGADTAANVLSGALDGLATVVRFPWGGRVEVEALR